VKASRTEVCRARNFLWVEKYWTSWIQNARMRHRWQN
jgi:hypothetical protein